MYVQSNYVLQCWIHGDSLRDYLIGFFVLDPTTLAKWAAGKGIEVDNSIVDNKDLRQTIFDDLM